MFDRIISILILIDFFQVLPSSSSHRMLEEALNEQEEVKEEEHGEAEDLKDDDQDSGTESVLDPKEMLLSEGRVRVLEMDLSPVAEA